MKTPVVIRSEYIMYLDFFDNLLWIHADVQKWTCSIKRRLLEDLKTIVGLIGMPVLAFVEISNTKLRKFVETLGMKKEQEVVTATEVQAFIYSWR